MTRQRQLAVISWDEELPIANVPDVPAWSENYCFTGYDYERHIGFFLHLARWTNDLNLWREYALFFLPDGTALVNQSFGMRESFKGPAGALVSVQFEEPGNRLDIRYRGPARRARLSELLTAPLPDTAAMEAMNLELQFVGTAPVWRMAKQDQSSIQTWHIEQQGSISGTFKHGDKTYVFNGHGYRDHSRGPRRVAAVRGQCWIQGRFKDGDSFAVFHNWQENDQGSEVVALAEAAVFHEQELRPATIIRSPRIRDHQDILDEAELILEHDAGQMVLRCFPLNTAVYSIPVDYQSISFGQHLGNSRWPLVLIEQPAVFWCADRIAEGWIERCYHRRDNVFDDAKTAALYAVRRQKHSAWKE